MISYSILEQTTSVDAAAPAVMSDVSCIGNLSSEEMFVGAIDSCGILDEE